MAKNNTLKTQIGGFGYEIVPGGVLGGQPAVILSLGKQKVDSQPHFVEGKGIYAGKSQGPRALLKIWDKYGWKSRLTSGDCPLLVTGPKTLNEKHVRYIDSLATALRTANIYVETGVEWVHPTWEELTLEQPIVQYTPENKDFSELSEEVRLNLLEFGALSRRGQAIFEFVVQKPSDAERVQEIKRMCGIPNEYLYLIPAGDDEEAYQNSVYACKKAAKKNVWRYGHRDYNGVMTEE